MDAPTIYYAVNPSSPFEFAVQSSLAKLLQDQLLDGCRQLTDRIDSCLFVLDVFSLWWQISVAKFGEKVWSDWFCCLIYPFTSWIVLSNPSSGFLKLAGSPCFRFNDWIWRDLIKMLFCRHDMLSLAHSISGEYQSVI